MPVDSILLQAEHLDDYQGTKAHTLVNMNLQPAMH